MKAKAKKVSLFTVVGAALLFSGVAVIKYFDKADNAAVEFLESENSIQTEFGAIQWWVVTKARYSDASSTSPQYRQYGIWLHGSKHSGTVWVRVEGWPTSPRFLVE